MVSKKIGLLPMTDEMYHSYAREYDNDPDLYLPDQPYSHYEYSEERAERYLQRQKDLGRIMLAIMRGDEIVGELIIKNIKAGESAVMGLALKNAKYKDQGIGTAAEKLAIGFVFDELDIPTLFADTIRSNTRSQHVLEKVGFRSVGEDKDFKYYRIDRPERTDAPSLLKITGYRDLDERKLMDVYSESNFENTDYFYPDEEDKAAAVGKVESGFLTFLKDEFFNMEKAAYWVLEKDGEWVSALRTCEARPGLYYLEALETRPDRRNMGYGSRLLSMVTEAMKAEGPFRLCDCVSKNNAASVRTHIKCGFRTVSEKGFDYIRNESDDHDLGMEYSFGIEQ